MKNKFTLTIVILASCCTSRSIAQDPFFSQYYNAGITLNPALAGLQENDVKVSSIFRTQWWGGGAKPYNSAVVTYESKLRKDSTLNDYFGLGVMGMMESSNGGILKNDYLNITGAYHNSLDQNGRRIFSSALSLTYANRMLNPSLFITQSQFGSFGFNPSAANYEPISIANNKYFDVNAGVSYIERQPTFGYRIGVAMFHAFDPKEGAYENTIYRMKRRMVYEGELIFGPENGNYWTLSANAQYQRPFSLVTFGAMYSTYLEQEKCRLGIGLYDRLGDAIYPYLSLQSDAWKFGVSYDLITSNLRTSYNKIQSAEVSLAWIFNKK